MTEPQNRTLEQHGFSLVIPENIGLRASIGIWSEAQLRDQGIQPPAGLTGHPELFAPLGPPDQLGLTYVIDLTVPEEERAKVSAEAPLRLRLPPHAVGAATDLLPVAYDGQDYLPVGYPLDYGWVGARPGVVALNVTWLPRQASSGGEPYIELVHALRLLIYKKLGKEHLIPHLRRVNGIDQQKVHYGKVKKKDFRKGDTVAVFVHGFGSDTQGAILQCAQLGPDKKVRLFGKAPNTACLTYDHLLAFDYEGFATSVDANGQHFFNDLSQQCGFHSDDGIAVDLFTHSMGSIVSRCMIELWGGHRLVDRLVESGAPNAGTPLAKAPDGAVFLLTILINLWAPSPPLGAVGTWLVRRFFKQSVGLRDLVPGSDLLTQLNEPKTIRLPVCYLTLAGENLVPDQRCLLERLWRKIMLGIDQGLDAFYGGQNDAAVSVKSMRKLRKKDYDALKKANLPCHHFGYFEAVPGQRDGPTEIGDWMCPQPRNTLQLAQPRSPLDRRRPSDLRVRFRGV